MKTPSRVQVRTKVVDKMGYWTEQWRISYLRWLYRDHATELSHAEWLMAQEYVYRYRSKTRRIVKQR